MLSSECFRTPGIAQNYARRERGMITEVSEVLM